MPSHAFHHKKPGLNLLILFGLGSLLLALPACHQKVGWVSFEQEDGWSAQYQIFHGQETRPFSFQAGDKVRLHYTVRVAEGNLRLQLRDPQLTLIAEKTFVSDATGTIDFAPDQTGAYTLRVIGEKARGGFELHWGQ